MSIRQAKIHGETIIAKPVLLVAIIDAIDNRVFTNNQFVINDWLEGRYNMLMAKYVKHSQFDEKTDKSYLKSAIILKNLPANLQGVSCRMHST